MALIVIHVIEQILQWTLGDIVIFQLMPQLNNVVLHM